MHLKIIQKKEKTRDKKVFDDDSSNSNLPAKIAPREKAENWSIALEGWKYDHIDL